MGRCHNEVPVAARSYAAPVSGECDMDNQLQETTERQTFGQRRIVPSVCIADAKQHIRRFLGTALEELGFVVFECSLPNEVAAALDARKPDLVVIGFSSGGVEVSEMVKMLAANRFGGSVLLVGPHESPTVIAVRELGEELGLAFLPTLSTPFDDNHLRHSVTTFLPIEAPRPPVDAEEALRAGWLELWYQPKVDTKKLTLQGAEALIRMRHPSWGVVEPAYFIPDNGDPHFQQLSEFVISRAIADWRYFLAEYGSIDISINLPISFLQNPAAIAYLYEQLPDHPAFAGFLVEVNGSELVRNLALAQAVAKEGRFRKVAISIDDLGAECSSLVGLREFPFVEMKVDRQFVSGCADDRLKRAMCRQIRELADSYGARTVAEGVEARADFLTVRELGFDVIQGHLLGKPMTVRKFAKTMMRDTLTVPQ